MKRDLPRGGGGIGAFNLVRRSAYERVGGHRLLRMDLVDDYKVPEAERFTHAFCRVCGSGAPRVSPRIAMLPAGSLDDDPGLGEQLHFFVGSKAPWYEITGDLPQYDEYPPNW